MTFIFNKKITCEGCGKRRMTRRSWHLFDYDMTGGYLRFCRDCDPEFRYANKR
jgi:hypothetical protein